MTVQLPLRYALFAAALIFPLANSAHHSTSEYDQSQYVELEGQISEVFWQNPHVVLRLVTADEQGGEAEWTLEGSSVSAQRRRGLTADIVNVGDHVKVAGFASTRRANDMLLEHLLLPTGREVLLRGNREPRWPEAELVAFASPGAADPAATEAQSDPDGLFRTWTWGRLEPGWWYFAGPEAFPLSEAALEKLATWNEYTDNPHLECIAPGMPSTMGNPYPIEFVEVGDEIHLRAEEFDVLRVINMDAEPDPDAPYSPLGHSVGEWEDASTLTVHTSRINWPYFNRVGVSQSEAVETWERFTVDEAAGQLHYELRVEDPWALTEPFNWKALWLWRPGEEVAEYDCQVAH